jgi:hypothetical protein
MHSRLISAMPVQDLGGRSWIQKEEKGFVKLFELDSSTGRATDIHK